VYDSTLDPKIVGKVIADFRKKKGISQEVLSGLADIGRTHLSAIERGRTKAHTRNTLPDFHCLGCQNERYCAGNRKSIALQSLTKITCWNASGR